jgi:outer membrane lipopolysaccharide assembly protein LptE/RlpB
MKILSKTCLILAVVLLSGCGLSLPSDRQNQTNQRLDRIHTDLKQIDRDLRDLERRP